MADSQIITLGQDGIAYVADRLQGERGLSAKVGQLDLAAGEVFTPFPKSVDPKRAMLFEAGNRAPHEAARAWFNQRIRDLWNHWPNGTLVFQDPWMRPSDHIRWRPDHKMFFQNDNVYFFSEKHDDGSIQQNMRAIKSHDFPMFFTTFSMSPQMVPADKIVNEAVIDDIARQTREIFLSAYDGEGFIVWQRGPSV